MTLPKYRLH